MLERKACSESPQIIMKSEDMIGDYQTTEMTILLVDDDDIPLEVGQGILTALGYRVLIAKGGEEALDLYKKHTDEIDLVILDMVMPGMNGGETFDRLKKMKPDVKLLLCSSCCPNDEVQEALDNGCKGFLRKPYRMAALSQRISNIIEIK